MLKINESTHTARVTVFMQHDAAADGSCVGVRLSDGDGQCKNTGRFNSSCQVSTGDKEAGSAKKLLEGSNGSISADNLI